MSEQAKSGWRFPWSKPQGYKTEALGLLYGLIPGWHKAYWDSVRGHWYYHSTCRVTCVIAWRYRDE